MGNTPPSGSARESRAVRKVVSLELTVLRKLITYYGYGVCIYCQFVNVIYSRIKKNRKETPTVRAYGGPPDPLRLDETYTAYGFMRITFRFTTIL